MRFCHGVASAGNVRNAQKGNVSALAADMNFHLHSTDQRELPDSAL
jgi:hypothetical protein